MGFAMPAQAASSARPLAIGIDLGTSFSRVAVWHDGDVVLIPNEFRKLATPSVVAFTSTRTLVGDAAVDQAERNLEHTIFAPQRLIGMRIDNPWVKWYERTWSVNVVPGEGALSDRPMFKIMDRGVERRLRPEDVVTVLLTHLRKLAESFLGVLVVDVVITIPARYGQQQTEALLGCCQGARLNVLELVKAPTAAGLACSLTCAYKNSHSVLVIDMGGSYFDFALLTMDEGTITERAIGTDYVDLDNCVVKLCMEDLAEKLNTQISDRPVALLRLKRGCEIAKRQLSTQMHSRIEVRGIVAGMDYVCNLNRMQLDALCRDDLAPLLDPIAWCLEDLGLEKSDVQEVVIVGGSAHIPRVQHLLREFFHGKVLHEVVRPEHAAVLGAAAYARILAGPGDTSSELQHVRLQTVTPWWAVAETTREKDVCEPDGCGQSDASGEPADAIPCEQTANLLNTTKEWVGLRHATAPTAKAWVRKNQLHGKITVETVVDCV